MSSPLSLLKKTKRSPLQGPLDDQGDKQKVQFRRNLLQEFKAALPTDAGPTPDSSHTCAYGASTSKSKASLKKGAPPSDFELMSAMMQRVAQLEKTVKRQAEEIEQKGKIILKLKKKLRTPEEPEKKHWASDREDLKRRLHQVQNKVHEMETFLSDYGLVWVGDEQASDSAESEEQTQSEDVWQSGTSAGRSPHINFDLVLQRINELNILAGESFVQTTATGAKLATKDPVPLRLYSNGIVMFDGPFRSYQKPSTQQCMQDLMDGYFPSELQQRFPSGVPFEVHDRRHEEFIFRLPWDTFPGEGRAVCGEKDDSSNVVSSQLLGKSLKTGQFLSRLPKVVVKAGWVIDIRDPLRKLLHGSSDAQRSSSVILLDTLAMHETMERKQVLNSDEPPAKVIITLKVKSEDGNYTYMVKMFLSETVGQLRSYLDKHRGGGLPGYDIISVCPQCCFNDDSQMLHSCGLSANSTLLLRKRQQSEPLMEVNKPIEGYVRPVNDSFRGAEEIGSASSGNEAGSHFTKTIKLFNNFVSYICSGKTTVTI